MTIYLHICFVFGKDISKHPLEYIKGYLVYLVVPIMMVHPVTRGPKMLGVTLSLALGTSMGRAILTNHHWLTYLVIHCRLFFWGGL